MRGLAQGNANEFLGIVHGTGERRVYREPGGGRVEHPQWATTRRLLQQLHTETEQMLARIDARWQEA